MNNVIITVGLPASGKSTWTRKYQQEHDNVIVFNRDSIREMLGGKWNKNYEELVKSIEFNGITRALQLLDNYTIIVDDTNLNLKTLDAILGLCNGYTDNVHIETSFLDTPVETCILRDRSRKNKVGEDTIRRMAEKLNDIKKIFK